MILKDNQKIYIKIFIYFFSIFLIPNLSFANFIVGQCSKDGYTIATINGINTNKIGAEENMDELRKTFGESYKNQIIDYQYLLNETHLAGFGDLIDAVQQGLFDQKSDYDLVEMLNDASQKVTTQKLLLVAHSQGNFYANNFYDKVASVPGGVPSESIGVYGVGSPADRVAGGGKYLTSDTDSVIAAKVGRFLKILPPNIHIPLQSFDGNGHSFSNVYLQYKGTEIVSDIKNSLDKLKTNDVQDSQKPCIDPPKLSILHKVEGAVLFVADPLASFTKTVAVGTVVGAYRISLAIGNSIINTADFLASSVSSFAQSIFNNKKSLAINNTASVISATEQIVETETVKDFTPLPVVENIVPQVQINIPQVQVVEEKVEEVPIVAVETQILTQIVQTTPVVQVVSSNIYHGGGSRNVEPVIEEPPLPSDITSPIITIIGDNPIEVIKNNIYTDAGATALDDIDGSRVVDVTGMVDTAVVGDYIITYTVKDLSNNVATSTRTVHVVEAPLPPDILAPIITILGDNPASVSVGSVYTDAGATALDDVDGVITVSSSGSVNNWIAGVYTITYGAKDNANNTVTAVRTVNVVDAISEIALSFSDLNDNGIADSEEVDVVMDANRSLPAGEYRFNNLTISNNAVLTLAGDTLSSNSFKGVKITAINLNINSGSSISADKKGYRAGTGPGASSEDSVGASHGGFSLRGEVFSTTYGSATKPIDLGSGGAHYYYDFGGGAMRIVVSDTFTNDGIMSSNGGDASSGGSIFVTANNISGSGKFQANGGSLYAGGYFKSPGGGGRIAIYYQNYLFNGVIEAKGGCGSYNGWSASCGQNGTAFVLDNSTNNLYLNNVNSLWKFLVSDGPFSFNNIYISNGAKVISESGVNIKANNLFINGNSLFTFSDNQTLDVPNISIDGGATMTLFGSETITASTLTLAGNSIVTVIPEKILSLNIPNITIGEGSSISADRKGYKAGTGPGASSEDSVGASYGGFSVRGELFTTTYGSETEPTHFGSGGANSNYDFGGGAIRIVVSDILTNNGNISSNGGDAGSGGSVYVTANNVAGSGTFQANGGKLYASGYFKSPGGGGRVALYYKTSSFSGIVEAKGGCGSYDGWSRTCAGDGTVHIVDESILPQ